MMWKADSVVSFGSNPDIIYGRVLIFEFFLLNPLLPRQSSNRIALWYSVATFAPTNGNHAYGCLICAKQNRYCQLFQIQNYGETITVEDNQRLKQTLRQQQVAMSTQADPMDWIHEFRIDRTLWGSASDLWN